MSSSENKSAAAAEPKQKRQGILVPAIRLGVAIGLINTFFDGLRIWGETPPSGAGAAGTSLLEYRLTTLLSSLGTNLFAWFLVALIMLFILRQLRKP